MGFARTPTGFVPSQDKQYLIAYAQLPDAATLDRTAGVVKRMSETALATPGVEAVLGFPGLSINGFTNATNAGIAFTPLKSFDERRDPGQSAGAIAGKLMAKYGQVQEANIVVFPPPPVQGLGTIGGFKLEIEDRGNAGPDELYRQTQNLLAKARQRPELAGLFSGFQVNVPQIQVDVDREKLKAAGVSLQDMYDTMQVYLGALYVNDFNRFGRTYQVNAQAEPGFRLSAEDIGRLKTRNQRGDMIPINSFITVRETSGPDPRHALQRLRRRRRQRRPGARIQHGPGAEGHRRSGARRTAQRHALRMDGADLSADSRRQQPRPMSSRWCCCWCSSCSEPCTRA